MKPCGSGGWRANEAKCDDRAQRWGKGERILAAEDTICYISGIAAVIMQAKVPQDLTPRDRFLMCFSAHKVLPNTTTGGYLIVDVHLAIRLHLPLRR